MNLRSLRFKLVWTHGAAVGLMVVLIGLTLYQLIRYRSRQDFDQLLARDGNYLVSRIKSGPDGLKWSLEGSGGLILREPEPLVLVTDPEGNVINGGSYEKRVEEMFSRGDLKGTLLQRTGFSDATAADGSDYRFINLESSPGDLPEPLIIHVGRSLSQSRDFSGEYLVLYICSAPLIFAMSCIVGWFLAGRALRPFEEVTRTAEKITHENLNTQIISVRREEEVERLVSSFNSMIRRLDESFRQMRRFNADVVHELRIPLTILRGEVEVALRTPNLPEEIQSVLVSNLEELDRLTRLINDMLTLAEAESGKHVLLRKPVNLKVLLEDLIDQMRLLATHRDIRIELLADAELQVDADRVWLRRALVNILDNAIKYSGDSGKIEVSAAGEGSISRIKIKDNGIGILPEDIPRIFDRFYRADPARSRAGGGAGLGLALVKWIVDAHHGSIHVTSRPDTGTVFEISIPVKSP